MATNRRITAPRKPSKRRTPQKQIAPRIKPNVVPAVDVLHGRMSPLIREAFSKRLQLQ